VPVNSEHRELGCVECLLTVW